MSEELRIIKGVERLLLHSGDRKSGTPYDFLIQFPNIDNVVSIEWATHTLGSSGSTTTSGTYNVPTLEQQGTDTLEIDSFSTSVASYSTTTGTLNSIQNGVNSSPHYPEESTLFGYTPMTNVSNQLYQAVFYPPLCVSTLATTLNPPVNTTIPNLSLRGLRQLQLKPSPGSEAMGFSFASSQGTTPLYLVQLDSWGSNSHSSGIAYWRALDSQSNQRTTPEWQLFPVLKEPKKVNQLRLKVYNADGTIANTISDWQIELELYTALSY